MEPRHAQVYIPRAAGPRQAGRQARGDGRVPPVRAGQAATWRLRSGGTRGHAALAASVVVVVVVVPDRSGSCCVPIRRACSCGCGAQSGAAGTRSGVPKVVSRRVQSGIAASGGFDGLGYYCVPRLHSPPAARRRRSLPAGGTVHMLLVHTACMCKCRPVLRALTGMHARGSKTYMFCNSNAWTMPMVARPVQFDHVRSTVTRRGGQAVVGYLHCRRRRVARTYVRARWG